ncbi:MAG TPA: zinc-dependent alcohol dehydrogenase family protein, partial [Polyangiales bacterium]|nr:zinc-dependent alcohol dehydrogenase family protein [Polyangiales bacterium]
GQILIEVAACGICRTDLHLVDGELTDPVLPVVPGHQVVGRVVAKSPEVDRFALHDRVGVPWLGWTCGVCRYCKSGRENLCVSARFTGYQLPGGYAQLMAADAGYAFALPEQYGDVEVAPLLCAGLIGYRALVMAGDAERIGLYGFGAAAHLIAQVAVHQRRKVYAFTRAGDETSQRFALSLGAVWAGASDAHPPNELDAAILFAPVGALVPSALRCVARGGRVVCAGIHMSDIPSFPYELLWGERSVCSVANLTRRDGEEFLQLAAQHKLRTQTTTFPLEDANRALDALRHGRFQGAGVIVCR